MEDNNVQIALIILGLLIFIFIIFFAAKVWTSIGKGDTPRQELKQPNTFINIHPRSSFDIGEIDYRVQLAERLIQQGKILEGIIERINNLNNLTNYSITLNNSEFYETEKICSPLLRDCYIQLDKKGDLQVHVIKLRDDLYRITLFIENGMLKQPKICLAENSQKIIRMHIPDLIEVEVPEKINIFYDTCYRFDNYDDVEEKVLNDIEDKFRTPKEYNKEHGTKIESFNNITITQQQVLDYPLSNLKIGFHEYNLDIELSTTQAKERSRLTIMVIDAEERKTTKTLNIS